MSLTRRECFEILREKSTSSLGEKSNFLTDHVLRLSKRQYDEDTRNTVQKRVATLVNKINSKWQESNRLLDRFMLKNQEWLDRDANLIPLLPKPTVNPGPGCPPKEWSSLGESAKRKRVAKIVEKTSSQELVHAASTSQKADGNRDASKLITEAISSPTRATKIMKAWTASEKETQEELSEDEALSLFVEAKLTKSQYSLIRSKLISKNIHVLPSYQRLLQAKKRCYPDPTSISISELGVKVSLQALLDKTVERLGVAHEPVLSHLPTETNSVTLISKWGFDGASGQSAYNQKFFSSLLINESSVLMCSLVPLQLFSVDQQTQKKLIFWQNPRPSSPRECRVIDFAFKKETTEAVRELKQGIEAQIEALSPSQISIAGNRSCEVRHSLHLTMMDGKACNIVTETKSTQRCNVCGALQSEMNNLQKMREKQVDESALKFGLPVLHLWIRLLECLLHLAYKLPIGKGRAKGASEKELVEKRKKEIQEELRNQLHINVDVVVQGYGTSNTGNTARTFFKNPLTVAEITGLDLDLIRRLANILHAVASGFEINIDAYQDYATETAQRYVSLYPTYPMTPTLHKLLVHGAPIFRAQPLPIGLFSEEAQEARNKDFRRYREGNTRKISRAMTNEDVFNMLMISSDPLISSMRRATKRKPLSTTALSKEVLALLKEPSLSYTYTFEEEDEEYESDEEM